MSGITLAATFKPRQLMNSRFENEFEIDVEKVAEMDDS